MSCVLITGAGGGLGRALARAFSRRGHDLVLADLDAGQLRETADELGDPDRIVLVAGDITDPAHQEEILVRAQTRFGGVRVLVNNAGITHRSPVARTDPKVLRKVMQVDWQAPLELALSALPLLDGALDTVAAGIVSSLQPANVRLRRALRNQEAFARHPRYPLLFDPQTAGG